jgi:hypothetical protein
MKGLVQGTDRRQTTLLPECLDDWVDESNPVRVVDVFVEALELRGLSLMASIRQRPAGPAYRPSPMLKLYIYFLPSPSTRRSVAGDRPAAPAPPAAKPQPRCPEAR